MRFGFPVQTCETVYMMLLNPVPIASEGMTGSQTLKK